MGSVSEAGLVVDVLPMLRILELTVAYASGMRGITPTDKRVSELL
jgi:hypothetical protein